MHDPIPILSDLWSLFPKLIYLLAWVAVASIYFLTMLAVMLLVLNPILSLIKTF